MTITSAVIIVIIVIVVIFVPGLLREFVWKGRAEKKRNEREN